MFALGLRLITHYSLGVLIWNFYQTFLIVCIELWLRFEPQNRSKIFAMNYWFIIVTIERKVCFCEKLFDDFLTEYSFVWAEICRVSYEILKGFFHKISKINSFFQNVPETSCTPRHSSFQICEFCPSIYNFILSSFCAEKFQKHLHKYIDM